MTAPTERRAAAQTGRTAALLGATGLVGRACLALLLEDPTWDAVRVLTRRPTGVEHARLDEHVVDFDHLDDSAELLAVTDVFCCLGTTRRAAGSQEAFRRVDRDYPVAAARLAAERGARQYLLISSVGADPQSPFFYTRVKGETEQAIAAAGLATVVVVRPALLLGERAERRAGERLGAMILRFGAPFLVGPLKRYRPIAARTVACAMVRVARDPEPGLHIVESDELARLDCD